MSFLHAALGQIRYARECNSVSEEFDRLVRQSTDSLNVIDVRTPVVVMATTLSNVLQLCADDSALGRRDAANHAEQKASALRQLQR